MSTNFDWMEPGIPADFTKKMASRFNETGIAEIECRARLLHGLKYPKDRAIKRIQDNIAWDFELSKLPAFYKEIGAIVDRVYKHESK